MMVNVFPCCARPCPRWMSRVKPPQVLSHLLLVVTVFAFAAPNVPNKFSGSNPHKSYLICFLWCAICFEYSGYPWEFRGTHEISFLGRKLSTSYLTWENGKSHEQSHHNPGKSWNIQWTSVRIPERKNIGTSWKFPRKPLEIPGEFLAHLWKI